MNLLDRVSFKGVERVVIGVRLYSRTAQGEYTPVYLTAADDDLSDLGDGNWREASAYERPADTATDSE